MCKQCLTPGLQNINALNLEPALPKLDDQGRIDLLSKPSAAGRNGPARSPVPSVIDRSLEKQDFLASLHQIKEKMDKSVTRCILLQISPSRY